MTLVGIIYLSTCVAYLGMLLYLWRRSDRKPLYLEQEVRRALHPEAYSNNENHA